LWEEKIPRGESAANVLLEIDQIFLLSHEEEQMVQAKKR
jgi:hypothetical protein